MTINKNIISLKSTMLSWNCLVLNNIFFPDLFMPGLHKLGFSSILHRCGFVSLYNSVILLIFSAFSLCTSSYPQIKLWWRQLYNWSLKYKNRTPFPWAILSCKCSCNNHCCPIRGSGGLNGSHRFSSVSRWDFYWSAHLQDVGIFFMRFRNFGWHSLNLQLRSNPLVILYPFTYLYLHFLLI